jgi:hypothetical protein
VCVCVARLMLSGFSSFLYIFSATFGVTVLLVALTASRAGASSSGITCGLSWGLFSFFCDCVSNISNKVFYRIKEAWLLWVNTIIINYTHTYIIT